MEATETGTSELSSSWQRWNSIPTFHVRRYPHTTFEADQTKMNIKVILVASCCTNYPVSTSGVSHPNLTSPSALRPSQGAGTAPAALPRAHFGQQGRAVGKPPRPQGAQCWDAQGWHYLCSLLNHQPPSCIQAWLFLLPQNPTQPTEQGEMQAVLGIWNTAGKLKANRGGKKKDLSPQMAWLAVGRREGGSFCSGFVPISKNSPMLSHSHLNEATLKSVVGLAREKGELCDRI